jgi:hypothetical protein
MGGQDPDPSKMKELARDYREGNHDFRTGV